VFPGRDVIVIFASHECVHDLHAKARALIDIEALGQLLAFVGNLKPPGT
jgi:hypothetical protein